MTKQLTLVPDNSVASAPASSETATSDRGAHQANSDKAISDRATRAEAASFETVSADFSAPRSVSAVVPARRADAEPAGGSDAESEWRLDDTTVEIGLRGIAAARAALTDSANAKAARDAETRAAAA